MEEGMHSQKDYLKKIQALCEFSQKPNPTGIDLEHIFQVMEETKVGKIWKNSAVEKYQKLVYNALRALATNIYVSDCDIEIELPTQNHQLVHNEQKLLLVTRFTSGPNDYAKIRFKKKKLKNYKGEKIVIDGYLPFLTYRALELLTHLPLNTLRFCRATDCDNTFATLHKTKAYCSPRCRNRMGVYAARRKQKDSEN
jgi:hypothetical protein